MCKPSPREKVVKNSLRLFVFFDYLEIQPSANYATLLKDESFPNISSDDDLNRINSKIVELSKIHNKMLVATGSVRYLDSRDSICRDIIKRFHGKENDDIRSSQFLRTTDEMLAAFDYLEDEIVYEAVVTNPNRIADSIELLHLIPNGFHIPVLADANESLKREAHQRAYEIYGHKLPEIVQNRLAEELAIIVEHDYSSLYLRNH